MTNERHRIATRPPIAVHVQHDQYHHVDHACTMVIYVWWTDGRYRPQHSHHPNSWVQYTHCVLIFVSPSLPLLRAYRVRRISSDDGRPNEDQKMRPRNVVVDKWGIIGIWMVNLEECLPSPHGDGRYFAGALPRWFDIKKMVWNWIVDLILGGRLSEARRSDNGKAEFIGNGLGTMPAGLFMDLDRWHCQCTVHWLHSFIKVGPVHRTFGHREMVPSYDSREQSSLDCMCSSSDSVWNCVLSDCSICVIIWAEKSEFL